jgi:hypothetical protein
MLSINVLDKKIIKRALQYLINIPTRRTMKFTENEHNYVESEEQREAGHEDTRHKNIECESKTRLGCNLGIEVAS